MPFVSAQELPGTHQNLIPTLHILGICGIPTIFDRVRSIRAPQASSSDVETAIPQ